MSEQVRIKKNKEYKILLHILAKGIILRYPIIRNVGKNRIHWNWLDAKKGKTKIDSTNEQNQSKIKINKVGRKKEKIE